MGFVQNLSNSNSITTSSFVLSVQEEVILINYTNQGLFLEIITAFLFTIHCSRKEMIS